MTSKTQHIIRHRKQREIRQNIKESLDKHINVNKRAIAVERRKRNNKKFLSS